MAVISTLPTMAGAAARHRYGQHRIGPIYLTGRAALSAGIDDNVYHSETRPVADEAVTLTPSLEAVVPLTRHARVRASGGVAPYFFASEKSERHTDLFGSISGEVDLGPLSAVIVRSEGRFRRRFSLEIDERLQREESAWALTLGLRVGRIGASASQRATTSTFEPGGNVGGVDLTLDRETVTRRFELRLPITRKTSFAPSVDLVEDRFLHPRAGLSPVVESQRYRAALDFGRLAFINGRVAAGVHRVAADQGVEPYSGLFLEVNARMPFVFGTRLVLDATRDLTYAVAPAADGARRNTALTSTYRGELLFELPMSLHSRVFSAYSDFGYLSRTLGETVPRDRRDHAWSYGGALLRRFGDRVSIGGLVQRGQRRSPASGRSYSATSYGLTAEVVF